MTPSHSITYRIYLKWANDIAMVKEVASIEEAVAEIRRHLPLEEWIVEKVMMENVSGEANLLIRKGE